MKRKRRATSAALESDDQSADKRESKSTLGNLATQFIGLVNNSPEFTVDLNDAAVALNTKKRRIYDITNVLEGIGLLSKQGMNCVSWTGVTLLDEYNEDVFSSATVPGVLSEDLKALLMEEAKLDSALSVLQANFAELSNDPDVSQLYMTLDDIQGLSQFANKTVLVVKAPEGATIKIPEPQCRNDEVHYQLYIKTDSNEPIDVYCSSDADQSPPALAAAVSTPLASSSVPSPASSLSTFTTTQTHLLLRR